MQQSGPHRSTKPNLPISREFQKVTSLDEDDSAKLSQTSPRVEKLMADHERAMLAYVKLADLSQQKRQLLGRDKFLILAGVSAVRAGWPEVACRCRELVLANNRSHLISRTETVADALRSSAFRPFLGRLERFCSYERAEHLLDQLNVDPSVSAESRTTAGAYSLQLLSTGQWLSAAADKR